MKISHGTDLLQMLRQSPLVATHRNTPPSRSIDKYIFCFRIYVENHYLMPYECLSIHFFTKSNTPSIGLTYPLCVFTPIYPPPIKKRVIARVHSCSGNRITRHPVAQNPTSRGTIICSISNCTDTRLYGLWTHTLGRGQMSESFPPRGLVHPSIHPAQQRQRTGLVYFCVGGIIERGLV